MTFKPAIWLPIATVLCLGNVAAVWFAAAAAEPLHATVHAGLGVAFGVWALRLRHRREGEDLAAHLDAELEPLELEINRLRSELTEAEERVDFAERMLAQGRDRERLDRKD